MFVRTKSAIATQRRAEPFDSRPPLHFIARSVRRGETKNSSIKRAVQQNIRKVSNTQIQKVLSSSPHSLLLLEKDLEDPKSWRVRPGDFVSETDGGCLGGRLMFSDTPYVTTDRRLQAQGRPHRPDRA